ncbi:disease resistance protein RPV1-like [Populus nigra]|uniref:disease resistance protein RPV1-like n=1 Tax=Populus nigra TaxID=3691 RepID=UPI002B26FDC8|nr:disease resistance protein RPV1-like [Populus nigra]
MQHMSLDAMSIFPKSWHRCPLKSLPRDFQLDNLVVLDMQHSNIRAVWKGIKFLNRLKILNLSYSVHLSTTPHFMGLPCLERIILEGCTSLVEVHQSIGHLDNLALLNLEGCKSLKNLPESICYLKCLETLNISRCINLEKLPEQLGDMEALTILLADGTAIERLPSSIGHLENLSNLSLGGFKYDLSSVSWFSHILPWLSPRISNPRALLPTFTGLNSLRRLDPSYCGLSDGTDLGGLSSLQELNFIRNKFNNLPNGIDRLPNLQVLCLYHCADLLSISDLPSSLHSLMVYHCTSMERLSIKSKNVPDMYLVNCQQLADIQGLGSVGNKPLIYVDNCRKLANNFKKSLLQVLSPIFCFQSCSCTWISKL